jgi:hypothetical protein
MHGHLEILKCRKSGGEIFTAAEQGRVFGFAWLVVDIFEDRIGCKKCDLFIGFAAVGIVCIG